MVLPDGVITVWPHGWCHWVQYGLEIGSVQAERVEEEEVGRFRHRHGGLL